MSINLRKRLFLMITRRYKSFKSEVAKRPPSKGTRGLRSGGITGTTSSTIHSGRDLFGNSVPVNASRMRSLLSKSAFLC